MLTDQAREQSCAAVTEQTARVACLVRLAIDAWARDDDADVILGLLDRAKDAAGHVARHSHARAFHARARMWRWEAWRDLSALAFDCERHLERARNLCAFAFASDDAFRRLDASHAIFNAERCVAMTARYIRLVVAKGGAL